MSEFDDFKEYVSKIYPRDTAIKENYPLEELIEMYRDLYDEFKGVVSIGFETWFATYRPSLETPAIEAEFIYEAGVQSKQAEIDEYKEVAKSMEDAYLKEKSKVDEFRKRIDDALKAMEAESENSWGLWKEKADMYEQGASNAYEKSYWILKGTTNEQ